MNFSHLEPIDCPLSDLRIFIACVISGIDLIFHSFYCTVVLTSWDRDMSGYAPRPTRYREVVLTSWDRRVSDCELDPPATRTVVLTSWDHGGMTATETPTLRSVSHGLLS